jgi:alpha-glucosidase (family GH31 glycosyl hydrolase)
LASGEVNDAYIQSSLDFPYQVGQSTKMPNLYYKTLSPEMLHYGKLFHKDVHNLYGMMDSIYTYYAIKDRLKKALPFIISRSTFAGSGRFAFHWTGDNGADFNFLQISIPHITLFQFFGIPFVGADVCGFMGSTTPELCMRWAQLGSMYPFMRNHNVDTGRD